MRVTMMELYSLKWGRRVRIGRQGRLPCLPFILPKALILLGSVGKEECVRENVVLISG